MSGGVGPGAGAHLDTLRGAELERLVEAALAEDVGAGDVTTLWTVPEASRSRALIEAKAPLVVAGTAFVTATFQAVDPSVTVTIEAAEGAALGPGGVVARLEGPTRAILTGERTALNFLGRLSGIATSTRRFVEAVRGTGARVVDTRKTTPGWRLAEKAAVSAGGGENHRLGLHDMALVKDNHAAAAGGVARAAHLALEAARARPGRRLEVEVEVRDLDELDLVLPLGADRILLDNMDIESLREAVRRTRAKDPPRPLLEASGNVTLDGIRAVAETGVDLVSVGALTHSAPAADVSLRVLDG